MIPTNISGLQNSVANLNKSTERIATKINEPNFNLVDEVGNQIESENGIKLNIKLIKAQNENLGTLLDIVG